METKNWTVYEHICPNGKRYIGITSQKIKKRWQNGRGYEKGHGKSLFSKAIKKYGWDNINHNILFNDLTEKEAKWLENYLICYYRTFVGFNDCKGYNLTLGGDGKVGWKHKDETKKKQSEAKKGIHFTEEHKKNLSISKKGKTTWIKGKHHSEETKKKQSEAKKGKYCGENNPWYGKHPSEESRKKMSESHKGQISHTVGKHRVYREDGTYFYQ